jgi:hypothetical protein
LQAQPSDGLYGMKKKKQTKTNLEHRMGNAREEESVKQATLKADKRKSLNI